MFSYTPDFIPNSIIVIGAGGTGSRLMPMLTQLVKTCLREYNPNAWIERLPIFLIDNDVVEDKNLLRQNFIPKDVGQPKASVLANRYSTAFGIPIYASISRITNPTTSGAYSFVGLPSGTSFSYGNSIVIMAVDSAQARRDILKEIYLNLSVGIVSDTSINRGATKCFIIDAGNEDDFGQVRFSTSHILYESNDHVDYFKSFPQQLLCSQKVDYLPIDLLHYDKLGSSKEELSCADLPQTLAINAMMATLICSVVQNFLYLKPFTYRGIRFSMKGGVATEHNSPRSWFSGMYAPHWLRKSNYTGPEFISDFYQTFVRDLRRVDHILVNTGSEKAAIRTFLNENKKGYLAAGMLLSDNGEVTPIARPAPPKAPALSEAVKVFSTEADAKPKRRSTRSTRDSAESANLVELVIVPEEASTDITAASVPALNPIAAPPAPVQVDPVTLRPVSP